MQYHQINNDHEFDSIDFSFCDHGIDLRLYDPSRLSSRGSRTSQYSVTNSLPSISTQPEPSQYPNIHSNPSTAQSTKLNLPIQSSQNVGSSTVDKSPDTVMWKVDWQQPTFMCSMLLSGLVLAIGHHVYYNSLNGTPAGDSTRQNWSIRFGTAFASLVVVCFKAVTVSALGQYFWTVVRAKSLKISDLDKLYTLTSNPIGMFSFSVIKNTTLAASIGIIFWCMDMVSFAPTATLSVIATNITLEVPIPVLDSSQFGWKAESIHPDFPKQIALQSASLADVVPLNIPIASQDWSYDMQLFGPAFKCRAANSSEQASFDQLTDQLQRNRSVYIAEHINDPSWNNSETRSLLLLYSAFNPAYVNSNWLANTSKTFSDEWEGQDFLFFQTSTSSFICALMETSINITIAFIHGQQQVIQNSIKYLSTIRLLYGTSQALSIRRSLDNDDWQMYSAHLVTLASILFGNISINQVQARQSYPSAPADDYMMTDIANDNPSIKLFGSCDDIQNSPFKYHLYSDNNETTNIEVFESIFPNDPWQCRNRTLMRAVEDLSINITIGYLSSPGLTNNNTQSRNITTSDTRNIYIYHPLYLILSYSIGFLLASLAALIGLVSIYMNGVSHSNSFSAIMLTTRNADLDVLTQGKSLASDPLPENIKNTRLRFGPLVVKQGFEKMGPDGFPRHVAFGLEGSVGELMKGGKYV